MFRNKFKIVTYAIFGIGFVMFVAGLVGCLVLLKDAGKNFPASYEQRQQKLLVAFVITVSGLIITAPSVLLIGRRDRGEEKRERVRVES